MRALRLCLFLLLSFYLSACPRSTPAQTEGPVVVATTTMLADLVQQLAGEDVTVHGIMRPGADPHLYQPLPSDARTVAGSHLVVTSGLHLEGWIDTLVRNAGGERPVVVASSRITPLLDPDEPGGVDPHFWFDVGAWRLALEEVADALAQLLADAPDALARLEERRAQHDAELVALDAWVREQLATIPGAQRVLVTSHDAFGYMERAYGLEVVAIQGLSTEQEAGQRDVIRVIDTVRSRQVPALFVETSVAPDLIEQVARETGAAVRGPLFSDSTGPIGTPEQTYVGMVVANIIEITDALGGTPAPFGAP